MTVLKFQLLSRFGIYIDGLEVATVRQFRLQALIAYLLLHHQEQVSRRQVAFLFWPDSTEKQAQANLRKLLHQLRRRLPQLADLLDVTAQTIQWQPDAPTTVDAVSFATQLEQAQRVSSVAESRQILEQAVELYKGDLLPAFYDDWVLAERERLRALYAPAKRV
ncbi:MAG: hypothetical protein AAF614_09625 [Chloroflexota bacterium]